MKRPVLKVKRSFACLGASGGALRDFWCGLRRALDRRNVFGCAPDGFLSTPESAVNDLDEQEPHRLLNRHIHRVRWHSAGGNYDIDLPHSRQGTGNQDVVLV